MTSMLSFAGKSKKRYVKGAKASQPETVEEYLEAAVELEEAGEKWRAGDPIKALRFFSKALQLYGTGLRLFPESFDLAYNQARLQYEITQHPKLVQQSSQPLSDLLQDARTSHLRAVDIDGSNTDALFNLAQVNRSYAELLIEGPDGDISQARLAVRLLSQAHDLLARCLEIQEQSFIEAQNLRTANASPPLRTDSEPFEANGATSTTEDTWAIVIEPTTEETLLDTCLAQLECLQSLCDVQIIGVTNSIASVEDAWRALKEKFHGYVVPDDRVREATMTQATFLSSLACARVLLQQVDIPTFESESSEAVAPLEELTGLQLDPQMLCLAGDIHKRVGAAFRHWLLHATNVDANTLTFVSRHIWMHLTKSLDHFTRASKHPDVEDLAQVHIERGDCELARARLGKDPFNHELAIKSSVTLLKNAGIYYGAANRTIGHTSLPSDATEDRGEVDFKLALVTVLLENDIAAFETFGQRYSSSLMQQLQDAERDGLVSSFMIAQMPLPAMGPTS